MHAGSVIESLRNGYFEFIWDIGHIYKGNWKNDKRDGNI